MQTKRLRELANRLRNAEIQDIVDAKEFLCESAESEQVANCSELSAFVQTLVQLLDRIEGNTGLLDSDLDVPAALQFTAKGFDALSGFLASDAAEFEELFSYQQQAEQEWGLSQFESLELNDSFEPEVQEAVADDHVLSEAASQIDLILGAIADAEPAIAEPANAETTVDNPAEAIPPKLGDKLETPATLPVQPPSLQHVKLDQETIEAFADDAYRCLSSIENAILTYETTPSEAPLEQICRDLHTLKGASASIQLGELAHYLHSIEDGIEETFRTASCVNVDEILQCVDFIRKQLNALTGPESSVETPTSSLPSRIPDDVDNDRSPDSIRVQAGQIDRLLDMLAELVMLRNRRDSQVEQLKEVNVEVQNCVSRIRFYEETVENAMSRKHDGEDHHSSVTSLSEIANDLLELGRCLRETFEPLAEENRVLSRFISQFRSEMMELRRLPVGGLLNRLHRIARDAGKAENKQVQLTMSGEHHGLERSLHEKLFEPLMHIVRNCVSHGIESPELRRAAGKPNAGQLSIDVRKGSNLFVIEVRDDGKGLDYDALRRRGIEKGLLAADRPVSHDELANLIFKPGFSTRDEVNEISGRGVGMDVVAASVESMHGWIEMESIPGQGTCVRVLVPRCSFIEHAMVFEAGNRKFAIPTQFVKAQRNASSGKSQHGELQVLDFREFIGVKARQNIDHASIIVQATDATSTKKNGELKVIVDQIIGPEEVVIRPLPSLLKSQTLFSGVTLSGCGTLMLLIDPRQLLENGKIANPEPATFSPERTKQRVLVVDDSLSSRRALVRKLSRIEPMDITQATNGAEAIQLLASSRFDAIFTDLDMPKVNGFELLDSVRTNEATRDIPVTVVSGRSDSSSKATAQKLGANGFLIKPATDSSIKQALEKMELVNLA